MGDIFLNLVNISITASWITLAVIILRFAFKKAPKWITCALWAVVALRLVMPFSLESALSLVPSAQTIAPSYSEAQRLPEIETGINIIDAPLNEYIDTNFVEGTAQTADKITFDGVMEIASVVWLVGVFAMLAYGLVSYLRLKYKVRISLPCGENVCCCDDIASPFILGVFRPRIYLPPDISKEETDYVILHEKAHLKRKDHLTKPFGFILLSVYWFNPIIWLAYLLLCRDIELACDEKAIKDMDGKAKKGYSEALLSLSVGRSALAACPLAFGEVSIRDRIKSIVNYKKPAFWTVIVAGVLCVVFAVCFLTNPKTDKEAQNNSSIPQNEQGNVGNIVSSEITQNENSSASTSSFSSSQTMSATASENDGLTPEYKQKARQTIEAVKQKDISTLRYYSSYGTPGIATTQYRPFEEIKNFPAAKTETDKEKIKQIIKDLRLDEWAADICTLKGLPKASIYLDEDVYMDLEGQSGEKCWISICLGKGKGATFLAPADVYSKLEDDCRVDITSTPAFQFGNNKLPERAYKMAAQLIKAVNEKEISVVRCYDMRREQSSLSFHPFEELEKITPFKEITSDKEIENLIEGLRLDEWQVGSMNLKHMPQFYIYLNEDMHINLEAQTGEVSWMSINMQGASSRFVVPNEVYDSLEESFAPYLDW